MLITSVTLNNFRCFTEKTFDIDGKFVIIKGKNGAGKTSLLEALHYSCYLRSFRSSLNNDLINLEKEHFFVRVGFDAQEQGGSDVVQVGYTAQEGKLVKLNQKPIKSYKELITNYRIYTLTAEDLLLVSGAPDIRREFLNFSLILQNAAFLQELKLYKQILTQRNSLIYRNSGNYDGQISQELRIWTQKLWQQARVIQKARCEYLAYLESQVNILLRTYFTYASQQHVQLEEEFSVSFNYQARNKSQTADFDQFFDEYAQKVALEHKLGRSLFGAHVDDFAIIFQKKRARVFASRGQQKLITFLIKVAQLQQTLAQNNAGVLLLDDFLTDFDPEKISLCLAILEKLDCQIFITSPVDSDELLKSIDTQKMFLIEL